MTNLALVASLLIAIESGGNDAAVSPDGQCVGPLQEKAIYVADVNRIAGTRFTHEDAYDREKAIRMMEVYLRYYATRARLRHEPTLEDMARIHAGGPVGWRDPATKKYWRRVARELRARQAADPPRTLAQK